MNGVNNMWKISCCIDMMFQNYDFYSRFEAVKQCGINTVEFWKWSNKDINRVAEILQEKKMELSIFNIDSRDESLSFRLSRGILNEGDVNGFLTALKESIPAYKKWNAKAMIVLLGEKQNYCPEQIYRCLDAAIPILEREQIDLVVEPLNSYDREGYVMPYVQPVLELLRKISNPHIKLLYDIYHQNRMGDFSLDEIRQNLDLIGHFHVADAPGRHEPGTGNVNYPAILKGISSYGYSKYVGLEYRATKNDEETLGFLKEYLDV